MRLSEVAAMENQLKTLAQSKQPADQIEKQALLEKMALFGYTEEMLDRLLGVPPPIMKQQQPETREETALPLMAKRRGRPPKNSK